MRLALAVALIALLAVPLAAGADASRFDRSGISFAYPRGWHVSTKPLSNVVQPVTRFAVATFRPHRTRLDDGPCLVGVARQRGARGALVYLQEATGADRKLSRFPPRPRRFRLPRADENACIGRGSREILFRQAGRAFYLWISVGPHASGETRAQLRRIFAGLEIRRLR